MVETYGGQVPRRWMEKLPEVKVLPFSYGLDDPRYWHVESTEGRAGAGQFCGVDRPGFWCPWFWQPNLLCFLKGFAGRALDFSVALAWTPTQEGDDWTRLVRHFTRSLHRKMSQHSPKSSITKHNEGFNRFFLGAIYLAQFLETVK